MFLLFIAASLIVYIGIGGAFWYLAYVSLATPGLNAVAVWRAVLQFLAIVAALAAAIRNDWLILLNPPIALSMIAFRSYLPFAAFLNLPLTMTAVGGLALFASSRALLADRSLLVWTAPSFLTCAIFLTAATVWSGRLQESALARLSPDCVVQIPLLESIRISGAEFQTNLHALAYKGGQAYGWSFSEMGFYVVPHSVRVMEESAVCAAGTKVWAAKP